MVKLFCQNTGSYNRKTKTVFGECIKPTRVQLNIDASNYIVIDGQKYEVGEGVRDIQNRMDSEVHRICTIYDILKHSKNLDTINLMMLLPANYYLNKSYRDQYRKLLGKVVTGEVDGENKTVFIQNTEIYMEGAAAYLLHKNRYKGRSVGVLEIGGNTINGMVFVDGKVVIDSIITLDLGTIKVERELIDLLNTKHPGWNVQEYELPELMTNTDERDVVDKIMIKYVSLIKSALLEKKWNLQRIEMLATGGGAKLFDPYLKGTFNNVYVAEDGVWDNVRGLWLAGQVIFK